MVSELVGDFRRLAASTSSLGGEVITVHRDRFKEAADAIESLSRQLEEARDEAYEASARIADEYVGKHAYCGPDANVRIAAEIRRAKETVSHG